MPWVKDFDEDVAIDRATKVFWAKGYEATSIADLIEAMKINKGSLYNAFVSKQALFTRVLLKYDRDNRQASLENLEALDNPALAIESLFDALIDESKADKDRKGCLLVNTALDFPNQPEEIQRMVTNALLDFERFFSRLVRLGQKRGDFAVDLDIKETAQWLVTQVVGLRVLARGAFGAAGLNAIRSQVLRHLACADSSLRD
jgi:TetR/AcrR family transcriptional regulator, transcriptional repressor for nem operon